MRRLIAGGILALAVSACGGPQSRPSDGAPEGPFDPALIEQPEPRPEPLSPYGNHSPYEVLGTTYTVLPTAEGHVERGTASWYGTKFHGRPTSSGEPYDMYRMTAAHRRLPLPTWVEVTRLDTGDTISVRVNDRGPFHSDRIIDLSWAAAVRLGMVEAGTAPVEVRAISFGPGPLDGIARPARVPVLVQVGAFAERDRARAVVRRLDRAGIGPVLTERAETGVGRVFRVRVGPYDDDRRAMASMKQIAGLGLGPAQYVYP